MKHLKKSYAAVLVLRDMATPGEPAGYITTSITRRRKLLGELLKRKDCFWRGPDTVEFENGVIVTFITGQEK